jgi:Domain of unknown function (DUF4198)
VGEQKEKFKINKTNKMKKIIFAIIALIGFTNYGFSHGYWLEIEGNGLLNKPAKVKMYYGEYASAKLEVGKLLDKMVDLKVSLVDAKGNVSEITMTQTNTHWEGTFTPKAEGTYQILAINDTREVQDWHKHKLGITRPVQYCRTNYQVGKLVTKQAKLQNLDIVANKVGNEISVIAYLNNEELADTKVLIVNPETWTKSVFTAENGKATFKATTKGVYLIEVEWIDKKPGTYKDKPYETIRHKSETTIKI